MVNSGYLANPVSQNLSVASGSSATLDPAIPSYTWTVMEKKNNKNNPHNTNEQQLLFKTKNGKIRSSRKPSNPWAEEGYCNEATQSGPSTHS